MSTRFSNKEATLKIKPNTDEIPQRLLAKTNHLCQIALHLVQQPSSLSPIIIRNFLRNISNVRSVFKNLIKTHTTGTNNNEEDNDPTKVYKSNPFIRYLSEIGHWKPGLPQKIREEQGNPKQHQRASQQHQGPWRCKELKSAGPQKRAHKRYKKPRQNSDSQTAKRYRRGRWKTRGQKSTTRHQRDQRHNKLPYNTSNHQSPRHHHWGRQWSNGV